MTRNDFKSILRPLLKETIKEVLLEQNGILSHIIKEVLAGSTHVIIEALSKQQTQQPRVAKKQAEPSFSLEDEEDRVEQKKRMLQEQREKLLKAVNKDAYGGIDVFAGLTPIPSQRESGDASLSKEVPALRDIDPGDPGIDISGLVKLSGKKWSTLKK